MTQAFDMTLEILNIDNQSPKISEHYRSIVRDLATKLLGCSGVCLSELFANGRNRTVLINHGPVELRRKHKAFVSEVLNEAELPVRPSHSSARIVIVDPDGRAGRVVHRAGPDMGGRRTALSLAWSTDRAGGETGLQQEAIAWVAAIVDLWVAHSETLATSRVLSHALDLLDVACFLARADGSARPVNRAARAMSTGRLVSDGKWSTATRRARQDGGSTIALAAWETTGAPTRPAYMVEISPRSGSGAVAIVLVPAATPAPVAPRALEIGLGLTRSEAALTAELVRHLDLGETARALGLSKQTVRSYLKRIFCKLGIGKQAELVLLAIAQTPPLFRTRR